MTRLRKLIRGLPLTASTHRAVDEYPTDKLLRAALVKALNDWSRSCMYTQAEVVAREDASYERGRLDLRKQQQRVSIEGISYHHRYSDGKLAHSHSRASDK